MRIRSWLAGCVLALSAVPLAAAPASAAPSRWTLWQLTDLAAGRVLLADQVAAAKFGTLSPIDDPVRERQILDVVTAQAPALGLDPVAVARFFRDQTEASKLVQRGLFARWSAHPDQAPATRPDLAEIRPAIDRLNASLLAELAATSTARASRTGPIQRAVAARVVGVARRLDPLHVRALAVAVGSLGTR